MPESTPEGREILKTCPGSSKNTLFSVLQAHCFPTDLTRLSAPHLNTIPPKFPPVKMTGGNGSPAGNLVPANDICFCRVYDENESGTTMGRELIFFHVQTGDPVMSDPAASSDAKIEREIDAVDLKILEQLDERRELVRQLWQDDTGPVTGRVAQAARRIGKLSHRKSGTSAVDQEGRAEVLRHIASLCLQSLSRVQVFFLGPKHSYSHLAAIEYFGDAANFVPVGSIPAVFESVRNGGEAIGIVPIENSTDGRVVDTLGMFVRDADLQICGEVILPIHHNLLSCTPRNEITEVHSKPQALSQCRRWLSGQLPQAKLVEVSSTAVAAQHAAQRQGVAAVASVQAGRQYGLDVIEPDIEDNPNNVTRFAVLGKELPEPSGDDKTSLLFQVNHEPGALADAMTVFKENGLNLTWIESFPSPLAKNEYLFFVELRGHRKEDAVRIATESLGAKSQRLTILGSYPRAETA